MSELVFVVSPRQNAFFRELAELLCAEIEDAGGSARTSLDGFPSAEPGRAYALLPPHEYRQLEGAVGWPDRATLARTVLITAEQPGGPHFAQNIPLASWAGALFDLNRLAARRYRELGLPVEHLPLGYSRHWDRFGSGADREVDVLFMAAGTKRRLRALSSYAGNLVAARSRLVVSDDRSPNVASSESFVAGEEKRELLARSKVLLNVHRGEAPYFEWLRVLEAIHCGTAVVSERSLDHEPLEPGVHFVGGDLDHLGRLATELAADSPQREPIATAAYEAIRERMPLRASAERLLEAAERLGSSPPLRAPRPRALRAAATGAVMGRIRRPFWNVVSPLTQRGGDPRTMHASLKDVRLELLEAGRKLRALEASARDGRLPGEEVETVLAPSGRPPRVSVICALYDQAEHVRGALDSVAAQSDSDWELVVVDDGSGDGSGEVVAAWAQEHPDARLSLHRHPVNRGLPATRNTAFARARGELVLVLDSDNELHPPCIERLRSALADDPEADFAYGILEQFSAGGPVGLSGQFGWDPERLVEENYIDALALVRRATLERLGGYTSDRRLYGWEDYDLWCRIAEEGGHGAHVPEIVARYRLSPSSMISLTNVSVADAGEALAERCPRLFATGEVAA